MEEKINIVEILKDKPQGTKLYSSACGKCKLEEVDDKSFKISFYNSKFGFMNGGEGYLDKKGKLYDDGECIVFPSKEMRNWSKFAWKKGDVLVTEDGSTKAIFECFEDDTYLTFKGKYCLQKTNIDETFIVDTKKNLTECFSLQAKNIAQIYIHNIEDRMGGILNMETLEIEKTQPEFKDGDIVFMKGIKGGYYANCIFILKSEYKDGDERAFYYAFYNTDDKFTIAEYGNTRVHYSLRTATDSEKQQLFDALAKKGKTWDAEKKQIVDLKPKIKLKPFDRVLCRDGVGKEWHIDLFESVLTDNSEYNYKCMVNVWKICIPYKGNEYLLGTTKDVEG